MTTESSHAATVPSPTVLRRLAQMANIKQIDIAREIGVS